MPCDCAATVFECSVLVMTSPTTGRMAAASTAAKAGDTATLKSAGNATRERTNSRAGLARQARRLDAGSIVATACLGLRLRKALRNLEFIRGQCLSLDAAEHSLVGCG